jgi:hypothetical protein
VDKKKVKKEEETKSDKPAKQGDTVAAKTNTVRKSTNVDVQLLF